MDVFGAFQFCAIGILAAPVTIMLSSTYFEHAGRNIIFVWSGIILSGLLSLTVEFYRIRTHDCTHDNFGNRISTRISEFPYMNATCGLTCSVKDGPHSTMRKGSANDIYVIPAPDNLTFGEAMLLSAACCIPTILLIISMWIKILQINWRVRFGRVIDDESIGEVKTVNRILALLRKFFGIPIFAAAVLAVLIIGENNLFSRQVSQYTEPVANIGKSSCHLFRYPYCS